ncbi:MAG: biopolymer transporter ExbD [Cypionkella sp.]|jgi:biopolymer transport protein ExbD|nr:biopolymer transporter ExbD [Cypionkella sp.]
MDFSDPARKKPEENLLPMINVVFLLLIFFLISARMTPPEPFAVTPPEARTEAEAQGEFTLFLAADGRIGYREMLGEAAMQAIGAARADHCARLDCTAEPPRLTLRADLALPAADLARVLPQVAGLGFGQIELVAQTGAVP